MKKSKFLLAILVLVIAISTIFVGTNSYATEVENTEDETLVTAQEEVQTVGGDTPEIYNGDLYVMFGEDSINDEAYIMDKYVDGNVFILGNNVKVTGQINGSLFICATNVTIEKDAYIGCHVFVVSQNFVMRGIAFDVYAACGSYEMGKDALIYRDLKLATDDAFLRGIIGRDVDLVSNKIDVYEDDENCVDIRGNLNYTSNTEIEDIDKLTVGGEIKFTKAEENKENGSIVGDYIFGAVQEVVFTIIIFALMLFLAPKFIEKSKEYISTRCLLAGAIGLAFTIIVPIVAFILLLTLVGIEVAIFAVLGYASVLMLNSAVVSIAIDEFITNKVEKLNTRPWKILILVPISIIMYLIKQIPVIGSFISAIIFLVGVGIIILYQFDKRKKEVQ